MLYIAIAAATLPLGLSAPQFAVSFPTRAPPKNAPPKAHEEMRPAASGSPVPPLSAADGGGSSSTSAGNSINDLIRLATMGNERLSSPDNLKDRQEGGDLQAGGSGGRKDLPVAVARPKDPSEGPRARVHIQTSGGQTKVRIGGASASPAADQGKRAKGKGKARMTEIKSDESFNKEIL